MSEEQALREELSRTLGHVAWPEVVADLEAADVFWGRTAEETGRKRIGHRSAWRRHDEGPRHYPERGQAERRCPEPHGRAQAIEEPRHRDGRARTPRTRGAPLRAEGHLWASIMGAVLGNQALGLSPAQLEKAPQVVSRHRRLVGAT
ncbi:MAG: hypothetical protein ABSA65_18065 [Acidimicrobiales bacterium]